MRRTYWNFFTDNRECIQQVSKRSCKATKTIHFLMYNQVGTSVFLGCVQNKGSPSAQVGILYETDTVGKAQRITVRWTCRRRRNTSSHGDMMDDLENLPSLKERQVLKSSLTFDFATHPKERKKERKKETKKQRKKERKRKKENYIIR